MPTFFFYIGFERLGFLAGGLLLPYTFFLWVEGVYWDEISS